MSVFELFISAIFVNNIVLAQYLGCTVSDLLGEENVKAAAPEGSGQYEEFARIFKELTPENQNKIIAEMLRRAREQ